MMNVLKVERRERKHIARKGLELTKLLKLLTTSFCFEFRDCVSCKHYYVVLLRKNPKCPSHE